MEGGGCPLKVSIVQAGGLAGLVTTTVADSDALSAEDANELRRKVNQAGLFTLRPAQSHRAGATQPDSFGYELTVEDGPRRNRLVLSEAELSSAVRSLISFVTSVPGHEEQVAPPGR